MPASVTVRVVPKPAVLGMTAHLTCNWSDAFPAKIDGVRWAIHADTGDKSLLGTAKHQLSHSRQHLQVFDLQPSDDASYECVVSNAAGDGIGMTRVVVHGQYRVFVYHTSLELNWVK